MKPLNLKGKTITIFSLLIVLVLLLIVFFISEKGEVKVLKKKEFVIGEFSSKDVSFLSIYFKDYYDRTKEYNYTVFKSNDSWFVSYSNIIDRVEPKLANFVVNILGDIENLGTIASNEVEDTITTFGFNSPNAQIIFDVKGKTNKITVGNLAPTKDYYYTIINDDTSKIYLVYAYKIDNILKYPYEVRDKNIFTYEWTNITYFEYKPISETDIITFTNKNKRWFSIKPFDKEVDTTFIETEFLRNLRSISIESFIDKDNKNYNIISKTNSPIGFVKLFNSSNEYLLLILTNISTNFYCYDPQRRQLFTIDYESTKTLFDSTYERFVKINTESK